MMKTCKVSKLFISSFSQCQSSLIFNNFSFSTFKSSKTNSTMWIGLELNRLGVNLPRHPCRMFSIYSCLDVQRYGDCFFYFRSSSCFVYSYESFSFSIHSFKLLKRVSSMMPSSPRFLLLLSHHHHHHDRQVLLLVHIHWASKFTVTQCVWNGRLDCDSLSISMWKTSFRERVVRKESFGNVYCI